MLISLAAAAETASVDAFMPPALQMLQRTFVALVVGLLIGIERERSTAQTDAGASPAGARAGVRAFAGARTFPLIAWLGAGTAILHPQLGAAGVITGFLVVAALVLVSYRRSSGEGEIGATTEVAALGTYVLGAFAGYGELVVAGAAGVGVAVLLAAKPHLESFSRALRQEELVAVLQLAVISVIILPVLPDRGYGPYEALNPFKIWLLVVLISSISFAGFMAIRLFGARAGLLVSALVGALVSSTAVTVAMAERSRQAPGDARLAAAGAVLASVVMGVRVAVLTAIAGSAALPLLLPALGTMSLVGGAAAALLARGGLGAGAAPAEPRTVANPFRLRTALTFAGVFALVSLLVRAAREHFGEIGLFVAATASGLADVDAITLALARGAGESTTLRDAAVGIGLAVVSNTLVKLGIAVSAGQGVFRRHVGIALGAMAVAGLAAAAATFARG